MRLLLLSFVIILFCTILSLRVRQKKGSFVIHDFNVARTTPLRGILALVIVTHHLSEYIIGLKIPIICEFPAWGTCAVCTFFFLTGYGLVFSYMSKGTSYIDNFLSHRFAKLLPPFLFAMFGYMAIRCLFWDESILSQLTRLTQGYTPLPFSWYVWAVILFYLAFYVSARTLKSVKSIVIALWVVSVIYCITIQVLGWAPYWYDCTYAINVGMTYALYERHIKNALQNKPHLIIIIACMLTISQFACFTIGGMHLEIRGFDVQYLIYNMGSWFLPILIVLAIYVMGMKQNRCLNFLGKHSYEVYLMSGFFIVGYSSICTHWKKYILAVYASVVIGAWLLHWLSNTTMKLLSKR